MSKEKNPCVTADTIPAIVRAEPDSREERGNGGWPAPPPPRASFGVEYGYVPIPAFQDSLQKRVQELDRVFAAAALETKQYELDEIEVRMDVSGSGNVRFFGLAEGQAQAAGGLTLKFKRKASSAEGGV